MVDVIMPQMGESITEGTILRWLKQPGDTVNRDEPLFEISTDKIDTEIPSPAGGVLQEIKVPEGRTVPIHTIVAVLGDGPVKAAPAKSSAAPAPKPQPAPIAPAKVDGDRILTSPIVRKMAKEHGVDLAKVPGTGWRNRITKEDMEAYLSKKTGAVAAVERLAPPPPVAIPAGRSQVVPMTPMRAKIADHMVASRRTSAHVTTVFEIDLTAVVRLREREKDDYQRVYGTKLTYTPFFAMAAVEAIKDFPIINSSVDGRTIVYHRDINLGMAVALPEGLIVPVIRNAEEKSFLGLCRAINDLAERARTKKLAVEDIQGGTFTITNPGIYGGLFGTPIINQPQVAIMGIGGIHKRPVVIDDAIAIRDIVHVVLSFDHRTIDGAIADQFMAKVKGILESWDIPIK